VKDRAATIDPEGRRDHQTTRNERRRNGGMTRSQQARETRNSIALLGPRSSYRVTEGECVPGEVPAGRRSTLGDSRSYYKKYTRRSRRAYNSRGRSSELYYEKTLRSTAVGLV